MDEKHGLASYVWYPSRTWCIRFSHWIEVHTLARVFFFVNQRKTLDLKKAQIDSDPVKFPSPSAGKLCMEIQEIKVCRKLPEDSAASLRCHWSLQRPAAWPWMMRKSSTTTGIGLRVEAAHRLGIDGVSVY
jgi:hypothetical protein